MYSFIFCLSRFWIFLHVMRHRKLRTFVKVPIFQSSPGQREDLRGVAAVLKSRYFMVVEPDKSFTTLSSPPWQLDNNFSALFPHCHFSSFKIYPLNLSHPVLPLSALLCHSGLCLSPPFYFYCCPPPLSKVVLLDTTTVLGELDWNTYPVNGVSEKIISRDQNI